MAWYIVYGMEQKREGYHIWRWVVVYCIHSKVKTWIVADFGTEGGILYTQYA